MTPLHGKIMVVMGASSGIGRVTAKLLASKGALVILGGRSEESLSLVLHEIGLTRGDAEIIVADASVFKDMKRVVDQVIKKHGRIDAWIHNAGSTEFSYFWDMKPAEIEHLVKVNLTGNLFGALAVLPHLMQNPGSSLVHVTTVEAIHGTPYLSVYSAAKSGVSAYIKVLRMELHHRKIDVHVAEILPAGIDTPFFRNALTRLGVLPSPMGKIYDPDVVANAILRAIVKKKERIIIGAGGKLMFLMERLFPSLVRWGMQRMTFEGQKTPESRLPTDPHSLFEPQPGQSTERDGWQEKAKAKSQKTTDN